MENFRRQFLLEAVETLGNLSKNLQSAKTISSPLKLETFRILHTIKGTAQTFGFTDSSRLAHELENIISVNEISQHILLEGIELLIKSLTEKDFVFPEQFTEKIRAAAPNSAIDSDVSDIYTSAVPKEIFSQLSGQEKKILRAAIREDKNLFCLEIGFEPAKFADELIKFREFLSETGEIIATFPSAKFNADGKIGFQILLTTAAALPSIDGFGANIIFQKSPNEFSGGLAGVLTQIVQHGRAIAEKFNKQIEFEVQTAGINLSPQKSKLVFDVLLHLVRNAVDHAIENKGEIKIIFSTAENGFLLTVADDGNGIDPGKIKAIAIEKNMISADAILTEKETVDLIFLPEFSTKSDVTEISGRGIGLDAVKNAVENAEGKINVKSRVGKGSTFEVFLPQK